MNRDGQVVYSNQWINKLLRTRIKTGMPFVGFVKDPESLCTYKREIERRFEGESGRYELVLDASGQPTKVQIFGTPVRNSSGKVTSAVAFVTNASLANLRDSILNMSVSNTRPLESLDKLRRLLEPFCRFDMLTVAIYDDDLKYSRVLYTYARDAEGDPRRWDKHWVKLSPTQRRWIQHATSSHLAIPDIDEFMKEPPWCDFSNDEMFLAIKQLGIRSSGSIFVREGKRIVASVSLMSKQVAAYDRNVVQDLQDLQIDRCVLTAYNALRNAELAFRYRLVRHLARCESISELSRRVVDMLRRQYKLQRVALYSVEWDEQCAQCRAESLIEDARMQSAPEKISISDGALAEVMRTNGPVYLPRLGSKDVAGCISGATEGSAFLWPVVYDHGDGRNMARWIFFAGDRRPDAFSPVERRSLVAIASDIEGLLEWLTELDFVGSTYETASDAIIVVSSNHEVRRANPAARQMFGLNTRLDSYFKDPEVASTFCKSSTHRAEAEVIGADGLPFPAVVNCRSLPAKIGGKVFTFEDISHIKRLEELGFLGRIASEISAQVQTPLTLAMSWIQRIAEMSADPDAAGSIGELAESAHSQLRRIQSCLDRIALYESAGEFQASSPISLNLDSELDRIVQGLPSSDQDRIRLLHSPSGVRILANPGHLGFVLDTLLGFFLRDLPNADKVKVVTGKDRKFGWFECNVQKARRASVDVRAETPMSLSRELGLVERGLSRILEGYDGQFRAVHARGSRRISSVRVQLPLS
ncbi:MAG TPA: PAS domain-containing protein [Nitrospiraceae bacterium]|nr:PAS domain-containing protein [Nitrospiraceae bacterium]